MQIVDENADLCYIYGGAFEYVSYNRIGYIPWQDSGGRE